MLSGDMASLSVSGEAGEIEKSSVAIFESGR